MSTPAHSAIRRIAVLAALLAFALSGCSLPGELTGALGEKQLSTLLPGAAQKKTHEELYDQLLEGLQARSAEITDLGDDAEAVKTAARAVWSDHPELYWYANSGVATTSTLGEVVTDVTFTPDYAYTAAACAEYDAALAAVCTTIREELGEASDYEKVKGVYEYVIAHVDYSGDIDDQDIVASLVQGAGVCGAYARAVQYLLQQLDVACLYVRGETDRGSHAWNAVQIGGEWYHVDATWGDPSYIGEPADYGVSYAYLGLTDEQILRTRTMSEEQSIPACTQTEWNYYRVEGMLLEQYDYSAYAALYTAQLQEGQRSVSVMFGSEAAFLAAQEDLLTGGRLLQVQRDAQANAGVAEANGLHYICDADLYILTVLPE